METTMFDFASFYYRIAQELPNGCRVCEVGVADGDSALYLAKCLHSMGKDFKLYMVDSMDYGKYEQMKTIYQNIIKSGLGEYIEVVPYASLEASEMFNDNFFNFVYIDSSHTYPETAEEIRAWFPKVKDEFILAGHDYNMPPVFQSVEEVVPKFFIRNDIPDREFDPEKVLHSENTTNGYGIWWFRKQWYLQLNK